MVPEQEIVDTVRRI